MSTAKPGVAEAIASGLTFAAIPMFRKAVPSLAEKRSRITLYKLLPPNDKLESNGLRLQYFPEGIQDSKQINYATRQVPGGSLPLYQWISGGERTLTFSVVFSSDVDLSLETVQDYKSEFKNLGIEDRNVDIVAALTWLRSFTMPTYNPQDSFRPLPPPKVLLKVPYAGLGLLAGEGVVDDMVRCVMTQCDIEFKAFFPTGTPRLAVVNVVLAQIPQVEGVVTFPGWSDYVASAVSDGPSAYGTGGYKLK